jgi:hypothetical protein
MSKAGRMFPLSESVSSKLSDIRNNKRLLAVQSDAARLEDIAEVHTACVCPADVRDAQEESP